MINERRIGIPDFTAGIKSLIGAILHRENTTPETRLIEETVNHLITHIRQDGYKIIAGQHRHFHVILGGQTEELYLVSIEPSALNLLLNSREVYYSLLIHKTLPDQSGTISAEIPIKKGRFVRSRKDLSFKETHEGNGLPTDLTPDQCFLFLKELQTANVNKDQTHERFDKIFVNGKVDSVFWMKDLRVKYSLGDDADILGPILKQKNE